MKITRSGSAEPQLFTARVFVVRGSFDKHRWFSCLQQHMKIAPGCDNGQSCAAVGQWVVCGCPGVQLMLSSSHWLSYNSEYGITTCGCSHAISWLLTGSGPYSIRVHHPGTRDDEHGVLEQPALRIASIREAKFLLQYFYMVFDIVHVAQALQPLIQHARSQYIGSYHPDHNNSIHNGYPWHYRPFKTINMLPVVTKRKLGLAVHHVMYPS